MNIFKSKLIVPESNETREIDVAEVWEVRWTGRNGSFHSDLTPHVEAFLSEKAAKDFQQSLQSAFSLLRIKGDATSVSVTRRPLIR